MEEEIITSKTKKKKEKKLWKSTRRQKLAWERFTSGVNFESYVIYSYLILLTIFVLFLIPTFLATAEDTQTLISYIIPIILGIQLFAIGLVGEIIIFTHAKELKEYTIEEIVD